MRNKDFLVLGLITLITVMLWLVFEIVHTSQKSTVTSVVAEQIKPISPTFNTAILKQLKLRQ